MKKHLLFIAGSFFLCLNLFSQKANLVVFAEDGDKFYAYINGVKQNEQPLSNVKVTGLSTNVALRIEFEDKALPQLKQNMYLEAGFEHTARIKRDMKKQMKLRYFGQSPLNQDNDPGATTIAYHSADNSTAQPATSTDGDASVNSNVNSSVSSTTITTTTGTGAKNQEDVAINMNMAGVGISMNVTGMDNGGAANINSTTSTTVTTTTRTSSSGTMDNSYAASNDSGSGDNRAGGSNSTSRDHRNTNSGDRSGCRTAMSPANFDGMKKSIESKPFSDTKMSTAKVATKNSCLSVNQVKEICKLFSMDDDKLTYSKFAYDYCVDKANYYKVSEVFSFSSTTEELNKFLEQ